MLYNHSQIWLFSFFWLLFLVHLQALDEFATKLIQNNHYAKEDVATRRDAVSAAP